MTAPTQVPQQADGLAERIRAKRQADNLSLREAGDASGVAFSTLGRIENGGQPTLKVHQRIIAWLNGEQQVLPPPPMALRDWFAGQIANGMAAHSGTSGLAYGPGDIAARSYEVADAMLAVRASA